MPVVPDLGRYWRTARHLRPDQAAAQLRRLARRQAPSTANLPDPVPGWPRLAALAPRADQYEGNVVRVLGRQAALDWQAPDAERLWRYHLHYHDFLRNALTPAGAITHWIERNPPGSAPGWEPYPLSRRIVNWIAAYRFAPPPGVAQSLALQARALRANLETHLLANHLFVNAKALVFAGSVFTGAEAREWLETGLAILDREIGEQILADGGHYERSPMYHALILEDLLDLSNLRACRMPGLERLDPHVFAKPIQAMRAWLAVMTGPDGEPCQFQDTALGVAPPLAALDAYAARLGLSIAPTRAPAPAADLEPSGYVRLGQGETAVWMDVGEPAPAYQPGHAHAAILAIEAAHRGRRLIVNSGISTYTPGAVRCYERSTAAHSTALIGGRDQSEMWAAFRVGRRARLTHRAAGETWAAAGHDGYAPLRHQRRIELRDGQLQIADAFSRVEEAVWLAIHFHLHPDWELRAAGPGGWEIADRSTGKTAGAFQTPPGLVASVAAGSWSPTFFERRPNQMLRLEGVVERPGAAFLTVLHLN
jgi:uncharacterized heparinase superfamily protein